MKPIPFSPPDITDLEIQEVVDTLKSGWITTGPKTKLFEKEIAKFCNTSKAVCLNSNTAGIELILRILGIGDGDEVIVPAYTYTASASVINHVGAKIVFVDCKKDLYEMDYDLVEKEINPKTKAIIAVDIAGIIANYDKITEIANKHKKIFRPSNEIQRKIGRITIIADAAHSFGAKDKNRMSGSIADFTSFSFHAVKNLTTAEGGAVVWKNREGIDNENIYKQYQLLSLHGQTKDALHKDQLGAWEYDIVGPWYKCNMTDIMAALGLVQFERYPEILSKRRKYVSIYNEVIDKLNIQLDEGHKVVYLNHNDADHCSSHHLYLVRLLGRSRGRTREEVNKVIELMAERGIATNVHYKPLPMMTAYKALGFDIKDFQNAYHLYENEITLPLNTKMSEEDVEYVVSNFCDIVKSL